MESPEKMFNGIFCVFERYLGKAYGLNIFEKLHFSYKFKQLTRRNTQQSTNEVIISLTRDFSTEIQFLLETFKINHNPESKSSQNELRNFEISFIDEDDISMDVDNPESIRSESPSDNSSNLISHYKTRRQRMLRESLAEKQDVNNQIGVSGPPLSAPATRQRKKKEVAIEWGCGACSRIFSTRAQLEKHKKVVHETNSETPAEKLCADSKLDKDSANIFCCRQCFYSFKDVVKFNEHTCYLKEEELQELDEPIFEGNDRLIRRWEKLKDLNLLVCSQCCEEYRSLGRMCFHLAKCMPGPYLCEICKKAFPNKKELNYHKKKKHQDTLSFFCDECDACYKNRSSLQKHLVARHEQATDSFQCDECDEVFAKRIWLTRHKEKKHDLIKKYLCQICGEGLSNPRSLAHHMEIHNSVKKFACDLCNASFHRKDKLIFHRRTHTGEKPFECEQCHKKFIRKAKLMEHLDRHKGDKRRCCELCPKKYFSAYDLKVHQKKVHKIGSEATLQLKDKKEDPMISIVYEDDKSKLTSLEEEAEDLELHIDPINEGTEADPLSFISSVPSHADLPQQSDLTATQIHTPTTITVPQSALQANQFYQFPQTLQIHVPIAVAGTSLDLTQVGAQPIILANFDFNAMNNLQF